MSRKHSNAKPYQQRPHKQSDIQIGGNRWHAHTQKDRQKHCHQQRDENKQASASNTKGLTCCTHPMDHVTGNITSQTSKI